MRFYAYFLLLLIFLLNFCSKPLKTPHDKEKLIKAFNKAYDESLENQNPDSALTLAKKIISYQDIITDKDVVFRAYVNGAIAFEHLYKLDSAGIFYKKSLNIANEIGNEEKIAFANHLNGNFLIEQNKYLLAKQAFNKALTLNKKINSVHQIAANYAGLGLANSLLNKNDSAVFYYHKALTVFKQSKDTKNQAILLGNIASVFNDQEFYLKARQYLLKAIKLNDSIKNYHSLSQNYNALGIGYVNTAQYDSGFLYYQKAIELAKEIQNPMAEIISMFNLAKAKTLTANYKESNQILNIVNTFCVNNAIVDGQIRCLIQMADNEKLTGNTTTASQLLHKALELNADNLFIDLKLETLFAISLLENNSNTKTNNNYLTQYASLRDSISSEKIRHFMVETDTYYQTIEKERQIELLLNKNKVQLFSIRYWITLSLLILTIGSAMFYIIYKRQKQLKLTNELAQARLETQKLQLKEKENKIILHQKEAEKNNLLKQLKEQEIMHQTISYSGIIQTFHEIREKLNGLSLKFSRKQDKEALDLIIQQIDRANRHNPLKEVINAFNELHPDFYHSLSESFSELTPRELQICALITLNMTSKEIAALLCVSEKTIEVARHRIRKKIGLNSNQNLTVVLLQYTA